MLDKRRQMFEIRHAFAKTVSVMLFWVKEMACFFNNPLLACAFFNLFILNIFVLHDPGDRRNRVGGGGSEE